MSVRPRVRAPELRGRGWLNTSGPLALADLRGRFTLLDFWTFCCVNCLHVLDELREVEEKYAGELVVVGVHSPKFAHEADPDALAAAVERYDVRHPVLDDPDLVTWQAYTARAWPTLVLVDPEGYVVAQYAGEGHAHAIDALLAELREQHRAKGTLRPGDSPYVAPPAVEGALRFPGQGRRAGGRRLPRRRRRPPPGRRARRGRRRRVVRRIGAGAAGLADGPGDAAAFHEPNGLCLLPDDVAAEVGYDVVVADTVNHALRGVTLATGEVRTLAGDGAQWFRDAASLGSSTTGGRRPARGCRARGTSPGGATGSGSRWPASTSSGRSTRGPAPSRSRPAPPTRGCVDGPLAERGSPSPPGLAADGDRLWLADSETSSLRCVEGRRRPCTRPSGPGLFDFGFTDGRPATRCCSTRSA